MKYINRELEIKIKKFLSEPEIIAILGIRQSGKSTLMRKIADDLEQSGSKINFLTFENVQLLNMFDKDIQTFISLHVQPYEYVFIDEVQYAENSGKHLKLIFDTSTAKIIISGSSIIDITVKSLRYLVGRILVFVLYPFSFREFLHAKDSNLPEIYDNASYGSPGSELLNTCLIEFLTYGGFPRVATSDDPEVKHSILENLYNLLLLRDIKDLFGLSDHYKVSKLIQLIAFQTGNQVNYNELSKSCSVTLFEIKKYISILEKMFVIRQVKPWYSNKRTEIVKSPKFYFIDSGLMNFARTGLKFSPFDGALYEQFICSELLKKNIDFSYWRTKSGAEMDFVITGAENIPIEIKSNLNNDSLSKSFVSFIQHYKPSKAYVLSNNFEGKRNIESANVQFLPFIKSNRIL